MEEALDVLAAEVREEILRIRNEGAEAMRKGDYATAKSVIEFAGGLEQFAGNVEKLVGQWHAISRQHDVEPEPVKAIVGKSFFDKARKGTITTDKELELPLLQALVMLGGRAKTKDAIDQVGKLMEGKLKPKDFELLKSGTDTVRWRNKVMWARNNLVNDSGLMKGDSPFGIWEISDKGRGELARLSVERSLPPVTMPSVPVAQFPGPPPLPRPPADPGPPPSARSPFVQTPGGTKGPQSNMSVTIRWDRIGKGAPERIWLDTAAATLVQTVYRLWKGLGEETLPKLASFRVSRGPLLSSTPARDFVNGATGDVYSHHPLTGTKLFVRTHSSTDEKIKELKELIAHLRQPSGLLEIEKHRKS